MDFRGEKEISALEPLFSGRFVATFRVALAVIFMIAIWVDPAQPVRRAEAGYLLVGAFLLWAAANVWAAFRDWWLEFQLARPALFIDVVMGIGSVYFTEGAAQDFATPLAAIYMFTLVEAIIVGGWRTALIVGLVFTFGQIAAAGLFELLGEPIDEVQIGRRIGFFSVIMALTVWLGGRRTAPTVPAFAAAPRFRATPPIAEALAFARSCLGARSGIALWISENDSEVRLETSQSTGGLTWNIGPISIDTLGSLGVAPTLFRVGRERTLTLDTQMGFRPGRAADIAALEMLQRGGDAISFPVTTSKARIVFVMAGLSTASRELLPIARAAGHEIEAGLDKHELAIRDFEDRLNDVRESIARDLHDSVAQSLAGASFRVEAARKLVAAGDDPGGELGAVREALLSEQRHVRSIIERLRRGVDIRLRHDLLEDLGVLFDELREQWQIEVLFSRPNGVLNVGTTQIHELRQIVREAVANASRHGNASRIEFTVTIEQDGIHLDIVDNGGANDAAITARPMQPRSITERVEALGGRLDARRGSAGARLFITIPGLDA